MVISIIMLLAALALPVLMQATQQARAAQCVSNLRQLTVAFKGYSNAHDGILTGAEACHTPTWLMHMDPDDDPGTATCFPRAPMEGQLYPYYKQPDLVKCPSDRQGNGRFSYSIPVVIRYRVMDQVENSAVALLIIEEHPKYNIGGKTNPQRREGGFGCSDRVAARHTGRTASGYFDGHVALEDFPAGKTARDFEIMPWTTPPRTNCGQDWVP